MSGVDHPELIYELRTLIRMGGTAVEAMRLLIDRLKLDPTSRLIVIRYFRAAFGIEIRYASKLGAWRFFSGGYWEDETVNAQMTPLLKERLKDLESSEGRSKH